MFDPYNWFKMKMVQIGNYYALKSYSEDLGLFPEFFYDDWDE